MAELKYTELSFVFQECVILVESLNNRLHAKGKGFFFLLGLPLPC